MTQQDEKLDRSRNNSWFCEINIDSNKVRDHCHLTSTYRDSAYEGGDMNVKQKKSNFNPLAFHEISKMIEIFSSKT